MNRHIKNARVLAGAIDRYGYALWCSIADALLGPRCNVTRERVYPNDRERHQTEHYGEGPCA